MKIYYNYRHLKNVPKRFEPIKDLIPDLMLYEEYKRLQFDERDILEKALLKHYFSSFIDKLKNEQPLAYNYLKNSEPDYFQRINRRNDDVEFIIVFTDGKRVRCQRSDFPGLIFGDGYQW